MSKKKKADNLDIQAPSRKKTNLTDSNVSTDIVLINLKVAKEWRKELKQIALDNDTTMTEIIKQGIELYKQQNR